MPDAASSREGHQAGQRPEVIAIAPDGKVGYVANTQSDAVTPINTATNSCGRAIEVNQEPSTADL
jgi:YVTN family beta-propeller protein